MCSLFGSPLLSTDAASLAPAPITIDIVHTVQVRSSYNILIKNT